ncbi:hypothetical protein SAMN05518672_1011240 [Chitinophaga sp. CF118]|uniref:hypothetical protein n=1 Tax=Chitinophaga sp. CF118 TaxID=1884367 RepID=UPI0008EA5052|nr:hypothetical protein [Chitinophaga sp. CF118]SFD24559.1 hypothetical protein SAMN05518672_1011240 [Chitinophaga sp. CF118]
MTGFIKQYRTEIRNILIIALLAIILPYLPKMAAMMLTATGLIISMALLAGVVIGMSLKVYFRTLVMRINKDNEVTA